MHLEQEILFTYHRQSFSKLTGHVLCCYVFFTAQSSWQRALPSTKCMCSTKRERSLRTVCLCLRVAHHTAIISRNKHKQPSVIPLALTASKLDREKEPTRWDLPRIEWYFQQHVFLILSSFIDLKTHCNKVLLLGVHLRLSFQHYFIHCK